ncbi:MAG: response regulator transcription factor [Polyangiaceae bacterium]|nr:response regulator transcription factor [Polyangiaceae bacterium]
MTLDSRQPAPLIQKTFRLVLLDCETDATGVEHAVRSALEEPGVARAFPMAVRPYSECLLEDAHVVVVADEGAGAYSCRRAERINAAGFPGPLLAVCGQMDEDVAVRGYAAGVHSWLSLPLSARVFAAQVDALASRLIGEVGPPDLEVSLDGSGRVVTIGCEHFRLTRRAFDLFSYLLVRREVWIDTSTIVAEVFPGNHTDDSAVARVQIHKIRHILGPRHAWVLQGREGKGYRLTLDRDSSAAVRGVPHPRYRR